ncbi:MAG: hypothetical protein GY861_17675 [bacterium]|nr:hypothetical protein [bacterium]
MKRSEFFDKFSSLTPDQRMETAVHLKMKGRLEPFSWKVIWFEVMQRTKLSERLLKEIDKPKMRIIAHKIGDKHGGT